MSTYLLIIASDLLLDNEIFLTIHEYGPMKMALKLTQKKLLSFSQYVWLSNFSITVNDKYLSLLLLNIISQNSNTISKYMELMNFLNTDRSFWPLSITMSRTS